MAYPNKFRRKDGLMIWGNLKKNLCPKCDGDFMVGLMTTPDIKKPTVMGFGELTPQSTIEKMFIHPCGFKIRERRMNEIINSQVNAKIEEVPEDE